MTAKVCFLTVVVEGMNYFCCVEFCIRKLNKKIESKIVSKEEARSNQLLMTSNNDAIEVNHQLVLIKITKACHNSLV